MKDQSDPTAGAGHGAKISLSAAVQAALEEERLEPPANDELGEMAEGVCQWSERRGFHPQERIRLYLTGRMPGDGGRGGRGAGDVAEYVLEWSRSQQCFHVDDIATVLKNNLRAFVARRASDYIPVAIGLTRREADELAAWLRAWREAGGGR